MSEQAADLHRLKIDRSGSAPRGRKTRFPIGWTLFVVVVAVLVWLFREPLLRRVDRLRLESVRSFVVQKTSPLAASAVSGTAANGYIVAARRAALSADTPGRIVEMNVAEGSVVKEGQVIARLYSDEYAAALRRAEADLLAQQALVDGARTRLEAQRADLARLSANVAQAEALLAEALAGEKLAKVKAERAAKLVADKVWTVQQLDDANAELERANATVAAARSGLAANQAASLQGEAAVTASEAAVREAEARLPVIAAERDQAKATFDKTAVRAPFDGIVVLKDAEVGEVVSPNSQGGNSRGSVATMVDWASLEAQVELAETNLSSAVVGASAAIYLDAYPDHRYEGVVQRIWPTANRQKATVEVRIGFVAPDERLRPEMGVRVVFSPKATPQSDTAPAPESILIPADSVITIDGRRGVFVLERDVLRFAAVELGDERAGRVLVKTGLNDGDRVVAAPKNTLADGQRVLVEGQ
ncbi:MAG: efflux RND transporter periplasmic adaptor subunit [Planctomycetes bacterium]|nr:efflux RND transporter periplasmic adaptor subunit [Planctomycetota bacterium]